MEDKTISKSQCRTIIDFFIKSKALNESNAILMNEIHVDLNEGQIKYLVADLMKDDFVQKTEYEKLWFDKGKWDSTAKSISKTYLMILFMPILVGIILFLFITVYNNR